MASSDDEWVPPATPKKRPANFSLLKAKKKKQKQQTKSRFDCSQCDKRFVSKQSLKNHSRAVHGRILLHARYSYNLLVINIPNFIYQAFLFFNVADGQVRSYPCHECSATFEWYANLRVHMRSHIQGKFIFHSFACSTAR